MIVFLGGNKQPWKKNIHRMLFFTPWKMNQLEPEQLPVWRRNIIIIIYPKPKQLFGLQNVNIFGGCYCWWFRNPASQLKKSRLIPVLGFYTCQAVFSPTFLVAINSSVHKLHTVDGSEIRLTSWETGSLSRYLQGFSTIPRWLGMGFLNHQQYLRHHHPGSGIPSPIYPSSSHLIVHCSLEATRGRKRAALAIATQEAFHFEWSNEKYVWFLNLQKTNCRYLCRHIYIL